MISFALMLMTLPSRVAEVRAERAERARHGASSTPRAVRGGLPNSFREGGGCSGVRVDNASSAARDGGSYNKER